MLNTPINASDPTGHKCSGEIDECLDDDGNPINGASIPDDDLGDSDESNEEGHQFDITEWLAAEMDYEAFWLSQYASCGYDKRCLYITHLKLFGDYGKYDIKRSMLNNMGDAVVLCGSWTCKWVDYSAPGNIMYGYLSASRGVPNYVSWVAAGLLEAKNAYQDQTPYSGELSSWGDNPGDKAAVDFGYKLYEKYPDGITLEDFQSELTPQILEMFQSPAITPNIPARPAAFQTFMWGEFLWPTRE